MAEERIIERYLNTIMENDYRGLAECFSETCHYVDTCPGTISGVNYHLYGTKALEMFFHNKFTFQRISISDYVIEDDRHVNFFVSTRGYYIFARATIERFSPDGLIDVLTVRAG
ncbi:MAG: hypothetical protein LUD50_02130 [Clostridia bacterium]|nr:hypothetical protein [Clostridia bacterium]